MPECSTSIHAGKEKNCIEHDICKKACSGALHAARAARREGNRGPGFNAEPGWRALLPTIPGVGPWWMCPNAKRTATSSTHPRCCTDGDDGAERRIHITRSSGGGTCILACDAVFSSVSVMKWGSAGSTGGSLPFHLFLFCSLLLTVAEATSMAERAVSGCLEEGSVDSKPLHFSTLQTSLGICEESSLWQESSSSCP
jgi:hypothetical protein